MSPGDDELSLSILDVQVKPLAGNVYEMAMRTTRGEVSGIIHPSEGSLGAVIWVGGASGGINGPADGLFANLGQELAGKKITSLRLHYRFPNVLEECVLDVLGGVSLLHGFGAKKIALVGHSFGGAVVITAGAVSPLVTTVVALSSQSVGTHLVNTIAPRPILLAHGMLDAQVSAACSRDIHERAGEPKKLVLLPNSGHDLMGSARDIHRLVGEWLVEHIGDGSYIESANDVTSASLSFKVFPSKAGNGSGRIGRDLIIIEEDITSLRVDAIVTPTNEELWLSGAVGESIRRRGAYEIDDEVTQFAPAEIGSVVVTGGGPLRAKRIFHAVVARGFDFSDAPTAERIGVVTRNCLLKAEELQINTIAFPALGTGGGGLSFEKAAEVMVKTIIDHLRSATSLQEVKLVVNGAGAFRAFTAQLQHFNEFDHRSGS